MEEILVAAHAESPLLRVEQVRTIAGIGLEGDRYFAGVGTWSSYPVRGGKDLTLIEAEVLTAVGLTGNAARRNIVTRGVHLNELVGRHFWIGDIECYGDRLCEPCTHLERLTAVTVAALTHRGGLRADILNDGKITVGDLVTTRPGQRTDETAVS